MRFLTGMFPAGHFGLVLLVYAPVTYALVVRNRERAVTPGVLFALALTFVPDFDVFVPGLVHRGVSHTLVAVVLFSAISAVVWASVGPRFVGDRRWRAGFGALAAAVGVGGHLLGDVVTPMGVRPFLPLDATAYTLSLVPARNVTANLVVLFAGILVHAATVHLARETVARREGATVASAAESSAGSDASP